MFEQRTIRVLDKQVDELQRRLAITTEALNNIMGKTTDTEAWKIANEAFEKLDKDSG